MISHCNVLYFPTFLQDKSKCCWLHGIGDSHWYHVLCETDAFLSFSLMTYVMFGGHLSQLIHHHSTSSLNTSSFPVSSLPFLSSSLSLKHTQSLYILSPYKHSSFFLTLLPPTHMTHYDKHLPLPLLPILAAIFVWSLCSRSRQQIIWSECELTW